MSEPVPGLDPAFLRRLERLAIVARRTLRGVARGERRANRHGGTVEFSDYRGYTPGDDVRLIDWYAYARLEQLFLKLYVEEQDLSVHLLLDQSASMGTGAPTKLAFARQLAVALAYVALSGGDRVTLRPFRGGEAGPALGPARGRRALSRLAAFLGADPTPKGTTSLGAAARAFLAARPAPGVVVVLSDLLDPHGYEDALRRLRYTGHEPFVVQVVAPEEAAPEVGADHELVDAETGEVVTVSFDRAAVGEYRARFERFLAGVAAFCARHELGHVVARTDVPFEDLVLETLRRRQLVR